MLLAEGVSSTIVRQSDKEISLQRGIAPALQPERREAGSIPSFADELSEFAAELNIDASALRPSRNPTIRKR